MSTQTLSAEFSFPPALAPHRFTIEQYHQMIAAGILTENDKVHLIEGLILEMTPIGSPHSYTVDEVYHALTRLLPPGWKSYLQQPVTLSDSEPEPDVCVVRGANADYKDRHPVPADISLVVEVAESSLEFDRGTKARLYASAGIAEYWIVNLAERQIEVYREPSGKGRNAAYRSRTLFLAAEKVPVAIGDIHVGEIAVTSILP